MLQESVPERMRIRLASWLHTATPIGGLLAVGASFLVPYIGWRGVFLLGVLPALLTVWLRRTVPEPRVWRMRSVRSAVGSVAPLFRGPQARTTWAAAGMMACIIFGLWSCTFWAPTLIITRLTAAGWPMAAAQRMASISGLMLNGGTLVACGLMPWIATILGPRRRAAAVFFVGSLASVVAAYIVAAMWMNSVTLFIWLLPPLGFFTNGVFALFTLWLPELFPTAQRSFGAGFAFSLGRVLGAIGPTLVGGLVVLTGSYPLAITAVSLIYLLGLPAIAMAPETAGRPLPA
jgi:MFS family permease